MQFRATTGGGLLGGLFGDKGIASRKGRREEDVEGGIEDDDGDVASGTSTGISLNPNGSSTRQRNAVH